LFHREAAIKTIDPETVLNADASPQEGEQRMIPATNRQRQNALDFYMIRNASGMSQGCEADTI